MDEPVGAREAAIKRLEDRRGLKTHLAIYLIVNAGLVVIWAASGGGYFWPIWSIGGWGIGLLFHAWSTFGERPISEEDIEREMGRGPGEGPVG
jgi:hypothetical protein